MIPSGINYIIGDLRKSIGSHQNLGSLTGSYDERMYLPSLQLQTLTPLVSSGIRDNRHEVSLHRYQTGNL